MDQPDNLTKLIKYVIGNGDNPTLFRGASVNSWVKFEDARMYAKRHHALATPAMRSGKHFLYEITIYVEGLIDDGN